ncbi:hypothetical protein OX284_015840 [Flavobacterium sp. SUN046]|uniref:hypothetical protein n=1 Tax=Flavobacterium sp. SUN046 TaxID=3002440 RepID=UPI002DBB8DFA|nr:hypothetical protein [Flavobacterium sp. SUN046]MEC4050909.1 hypothetical protein [Flavobacterium sp. SUN046]
MKKFTLKTLRYALIAFILINALSWCSLYCLKNASFYKPEFLTHEVKDKSFDYIVIGSSIGLTSINTIQIDNYCATKGINLSIDDTSTSSNYLMLQHFYKQGGKAKFCILSLSFWDMEVAHPKLNNNDYRFLPFITEDYVYDYYNSMEETPLKPLTHSRYLPFLGVSYYNTELFYPSIVALLHPNLHNRFDAKGNYTYPVDFFKGHSKPKKVVLSWKNPFLDKINLLCKEHGTTLIVYQSPILETSIVNLNTKVNFVNHAALLAPNQGFYDEIHLDNKGRKLATEALAKELKQNYFKS